VLYTYNDFSTKYLFLSKNLYVSTVFIFCVRIVREKHFSMCVLKSITEIYDDGNSGNPFSLTGKVV